MKAKHSEAYSSLFLILKTVEEFPGKGGENSIKTLKAVHLHTGFHKPKSTVVCFRAASSTNSASTLSWPSKSHRAGEGRESVCYYGAMAIYNFVPTGNIVLYVSEMCYSENMLLVSLNVGTKEHFPPSRTDLKHLKPLSVFKVKYSLGNLGGTVFSLMKISVSKDITCKGAFRERNNTSCHWRMTDVSREVLGAEEQLPWWEDSRLVRVSMK